MSDIATIKPKANGATPPKLSPEAEGAGEPTPPAWGFPGTRPYLSGRFTLGKLFEVELAKTDAELGVIRASMQALKQREEELIDMRDSCLYGIGILNKDVTVKDRRPPQEEGTE